MRSGFKSFRSALVTVGGQIETIEQMVAERRHRDPGHILDRQDRALQRLKEFHGVNLNRLVQAQAALEEFRVTVQRKESEWRIALAIDDAQVAMDPNATDNLMQDLLTDTALRTVQDRFNSVFAELDVAMSSMDSPARSLPGFRQPGPHGRAESSPIHRSKEPLMKFWKFLRWAGALAIHRHPVDLMGPAKAARPSATEATPPTRPPSPTFR